MPNKELAKEWLLLAFKHLKTAEYLYEANHYEDIIGIELQQNIEKALKSSLAYHNIRIPKSHDLIEIFAMVKDFISFEEHEIDLLDKATDYYIENRYPSPRYSLPSREEIKEVLEFTRLAFNKICKFVDIDPEKFFEED